MKNVFLIFIFVFFIGCSNTNTKVTSSIEEEVIEKKVEIVKVEKKIIDCNSLNDEKIKFDCFLKKAQNGDTPSEKYILDIYLNTNDYKNAFPLLVKLSNKDDLFSIKQLALMYHNGTFVEKNFPQAFMYFEILAQAGDTEIQRELAYYYKMGIGTRRDYVKSLYWYEKSAQKNDVFSMSELGYIYTKGLGVEKNYNLAFEWFSKAANLNSYYSMSWLGFFYEMGYSVTQDYSIAKEWYEKSNTKYSLKRLEILKNKGLI